MKRFYSILVLTVMAACFGPLTWAQTAQENIKKALEPKLNGLKIDGISKTQIPGLYEVRVGSDLVYMDESGNICCKVA